MTEISLSKEELDVLLFSLNNMTLRDEETYKKQGVSVASLYNKVYTAWELNSKVYNISSKRKVAP